MQESAKNSWDITSKERAIFSVIVMIGSFMAILDTTIVDVIVPKLTGPLSSDMYGVQWIITSYMIAAAIALLMTEYLIKRFGSKKIFIAGIMIFSTASFVCGISNELSYIVIARIFQGTGEAFIMVTSHIMIFSYFPPKKQGFAMGIFGLGISFAPALGPTIGGYLTEYYNWRMVFFINVPIGILLSIAGLSFLPKDLNLNKIKFNFISFFWISLATISVLIMLSLGQQRGWMNDSLVGFLLFASIIGYLIYMLSELNSKYTLIDFTLFKNLDFTNGILIYFFILGFSMYQYFYLLPIYYEHIKMLPTLDAGISVFVFAVFIGIFSPIAGVLSDKIGAKNVILIATIIYIITSIFILPTLNYYTPLVQAQLLTIPFGIGMGLFFAPVTVLLLQNVPKEKGELAIVLMDYVRFVGGSFGTALATNNMEYFQNINFAHMGELQNTQYLINYIDDFKNFLGISMDQTVSSFRNYETFMSYNYGFSSVFADAAHWGVIGSIFTILLFIKIKGKTRKDKN